MATFDTYVSIAQHVYMGPVLKMGEVGPPNGWNVQKREFASLIGDGFQGGIYATATEVIVAFAGTGGGGGMVSQGAADARIAVNVVPNLAGSAHTMVKWARKHNPNKPISIVGHSLGGAIAQVVGNWTGTPFISFNGPGMKTHLKMSAFNILKPMQMFRSASSKNTDDTIGICFTVKGDWIGEYGYHVGWEVELPPATGTLEAHKLPCVWSGIAGKQWKDKQPRDVYSIWPA